MGAAPARWTAGRLLLLLMLLLPLLLLLLLPPGAAAGAATAGGAAADDGNGDASGSGSSIQLMLDSFKEIASCPGASRVGCVCVSSPFRLGVEIESRSNLAVNRPRPTPHRPPQRLSPTPTHPPHRIFPQMHALKPLPGDDGLRGPLRAWAGAYVGSYGERGFRVKGLRRHTALARGFGAVSTHPIPSHPTLTHTPPPRPLKTDHEPDVLRALHLRARPARVQLLHRLRHARQARPRRPRRGIAPRAGAVPGCDARCRHGV